MNIAFNLDTTVIFSSDDPDYLTGRAVQSETFPLTPGEEKAKILFMRAIEAVRDKNLNTNVDALIEGMKDYILEWRMRENEYSLRG